jgi:CheY-like chemotaxis protein
MPASIIDLDDVHASGSATKITILLVEDEVIVAEDVRRRLENLGYAVVGIATRGKEAIEMAERLRPRLILMDIGLRGGMDGIETVRAIRQTVDIPVIFASAYSDDATLQRAREAEPQGFVLKPFEERELRTTVELALHKHANERLMRTNEIMFRSVFERLQDGLMLETSSRRVKFVNAAFLRIFRIPAAISVVGEDTCTLLATHQEFFADYPAFLQWKEACITGGVDVPAKEIRSHDNWSLFVSYTPIPETRKGAHHLWHYRDSAPATGKT